MILTQSSSTFQTQALSQGLQLGGAYNVGVQVHARLLQCNVQRRQILPHVRNKMISQREYKANVFSDMISHTNHSSCHGVDIKIVEGKVLHSSTKNKECNTAKNASSNPFCRPLTLDP